jgi:hypothetical protein
VSNRYAGKLLSRTQFLLVGARGFEPRTPCAQGNLLDAMTALCRLKQLEVSFQRPEC